MRSHVSKVFVAAGTVAASLLVGSTWAGAGDVEPAFVMTPQEAVGLESVTLENDPESPCGGPGALAPPAVTLYVAGEIAGSTNSDIEGNWVITFPAPAVPGTYTIGAACFAFVNEPDDGLDIGVPAFFQYGEQELTVTAPPPTTEPSTTVPEAPAEAPGARAVSASPRFTG